MLMRIVKLFAGIFLLPFCAGVSIAFFSFLGQAGDIHTLAFLNNTQIFFLAGIATYVFFFFAGVRLKVLYVFAHEATHALFTILSGGKVKSFNVSKNSGSVTTTKTNVFISLGPYFFPFYTILFAAVFFISGIFYKKTFNYTDFFVYFVGLSIAFHLLMTLQTLKAEQSDISENGYMFSLTTIYIINLVLLAVLLSFVFQPLNLKDFFQRFWFSSREIFLFLWRKIAHR